MKKLPKEPAYVAATLRWCNARRKEKGKHPLKKLPKGFRKDPDSCPCGKAAKVRVGAFTWTDADDAPGNRLPLTVQRFVNAFDAGKLPQYEL